jgi:phosphoenolpyruvate carboxykinase (GTP)
MHLGEDGQLWAINPEAGFFGVAPGTSTKTNPTALAMLHHDAIFTNVATTADNAPWWEGKDDEVPAVDWRGNPYEPGKGPAAHPNSRFTVRLNQCPSYSDQAEAPEGVPISAIIFGGRRESLVPLVLQTKGWEHGVLVGAAMASETTAAATGAVGVVRRDPMAMKPFCGYNYADYWAHWLSFAERSERLPQIFHVNWFRKEDGKFMWPGFGDNLRVLQWVIGRCKGNAAAIESIIGFLPSPDDLDLTGLSIDPGVLQRLLEVDRAAWVEEFKAIGEYLDSYGDRLPEAMRRLQAQISAELAG